MWLDNLKVGDKVRVEGRVIKVIDTVISITEQLVTVKCGVFNRKTDGYTEVLCTTTLKLRNLNDT